MKTRGILTKKEEEIVNDAVNLSRMTVSRLESQAGEPLPLLLEGIEKTAEFLISAGTALLGVHVHAAARLFKDERGH